MPGSTDGNGFTLRSIAVFAFAPAFFFSAAEGAIVPVIPSRVQELGGDLALAAVIAVLLGVGSLIFALPASLLTARHGERAAIAAAGCVTAAALAVAAFVTALWLFAVIIFVLGMAQSIFSLARQSYVTEAVPLPLRARALSTLGGVTRIGFFVGPVCAALVVGFAGLPGVFCLAAAAALMAAFFGLKIPPPLKRNASEAKKPPAASGWGSVGEILRSNRRIFATVGVGIVLVAAVRAVRQVVIPLWVSHLGLDATTALVIYGVSAAVDMALFYPAGKLMDARGRRWVTVPSMVIMAAALFILPATHSGIGALAAASLLGLGNGISSGMIMTLAADFSPAEGRAQFLAVCRMLQDFGQFFGPSLLSACTALFGLVTGVAASGLMGVAAAAILGVWGTDGRNDGRNDEKKAGLR